MLKRLKRVKKFLGCYAEKQRVLKEVWYMDDRTLNDIGVSRDQLIRNVKSCKCKI